MLLYLALVIAFCAGTRVTSVAERFENGESYANDMFWATVDVFMAVILVYTR